VIIPTQSAAKLQMWCGLRSGIAVCGPSEPSARVSVEAASRGVRVRAAPEPSGSGRLERSLGLSHPLFCL